CPSLWPSSNREDPLGEAGYRRALSKCAACSYERASNTNSIAKDTKTQVLCFMAVPYAETRAKLALQALEERNAGYEEVLSPFHRHNAVKACEWFSIRFLVISWQLQIGEVVFGRLPDDWITPDIPRSPASI